MTKDHFYSFVIVMGNEDSHIIPHPAKCDLKFIISRLREVAEQLEVESKKKGKVSNIIKLK